MSDEHIDHRGGARHTAGRYKVTDKKRQIRIGVRESEIKLLGGEEAVKEICQCAIEQSINLTLAANKDNPEGVKS